MTRGRHLSGKFLVISQAAISLLLLVVAGLFLRSLAKLNSVELGFQRDHILVFAMDPSLAGYQEKDIGSLLPRALEAVRSVPGVRSASLSTQRAIASVLYDLKPYDPATLIGATLLLLGADIVAAWIPARRASLVDPMVALRHE